MTPLRRLTLLVAPLVLSLLLAVASAAAAGKPVVTIEKPTLLNATAGQYALSGHVNPRGEATEWSFTCSPACGSSSGGNLPADEANHLVAGQVEGLQGGTTYTITLHAENLSGESTAQWVLSIPAPSGLPWWTLNTSLRPATLPSGEKGEFVVKAVNVGNAATSGPVTLSTSLPSGVIVNKVGGVPQVYLRAPAASGIYDFGTTGLFAGEEMCKVTSAHVSCTTKPGFETFGKKPLAEVVPYDSLELRVEVENSGSGSGRSFEAEVSGGAATPVSARRPLGESPLAFGAEQYALMPEEEGGALDARAGSHPYQLTTTFNLNQGANLGTLTGPDVARPPALPRNLHFALPPGQLGNINAVPQCSNIDFTATGSSNTNRCPDDTVLGVASVTYDEPTFLGVAASSVPLFNLEPKFGEPARFGFEVARGPIILDTAVRSGKGEDYGVTVNVLNTTQLVNFMSSTVTFWGTPGDSSHNASRGWGCVMGSFWYQDNRNFCHPQGQENPDAFLTLPTDCASPFSTSVSGESWSSLGHPVQSFDPFPYTLPAPITACNQVPFQPLVRSEPTSNAATSPTGFGFDIDFEDEGLISSKSGARAQSQLKKAVVTLPQGFTANPSVAEGLKACSEAEYDASTLEIGTGCTEESRVGDVEVTSPLVRPDQVVKGGLYVARQGENPNHNLLTLYLVARNAEIGVLVKQALKVTPDPVTGQLTAEVDNIPQLPFGHLHLSLRQGQRSPLITPPACGTYAVKALLYPWSGPDSPVERESAFKIEQGPEGQPCPSGGLPPFHPNLEAGTLNNAAGTYSPFDVRITRRDSEQEITHFSIKLPPGVVGKLAGIPYCTDAQIAQAKSLEAVLGGGTQEEEHPSCPAASQVGRTLAGAGVGNVLAYVPGKVFLAGPYHGAPVSVVAITDAKTGPFDLGTVVIREALRVNPETAEVFVDPVGSDPIPHIVDGIPIHLRDLRIYVDRPQFTLNPTSCEKTSTASTVLGSGLNFASEADDQPITVTSPFQAADCASLPFKPTLKLRLKGATHRGGTPAFRAEVTMKPGEANIAAAQVTLPHSEFLDNAHIKTICTRVQFAAGAGNGTSCPPNSVYGYARAWTPLLSEPIEGPVLLRSSSHKLPDLVAALHGAQINIDLVGHISSGNGGRIRNTFEAVPDAPASKFVLTMKGGKKGLLENSTNLCKGKHRAEADFTGHNGKLDDFKPVMGASCGKSRKKHGGHKHKGKGHAKKHKRGSRRAG